MPFGKRMTRLLGLMLAISCLFTGAALGESSVSDDLTEEELAGLEIEVEGMEDDTEGEAMVGTLPAPPALSIASEDGKALYIGRVSLDVRLRKEKSMDAAGITSVSKGTSVEILDVDVDWMTCRVNGKVGYMRRQWFHNRPETIDPENTRPFGVYKFAFTAVCAKETRVEKAPGGSVDGTAFVTLQEGAKIAIIDITDGWARVFYWRNYAYINVNNLKDLAPVSVTDDPISSQTPMAAYTSYYNVSTKESNIGRMKNITRACVLLSKVYQPGEQMDFNKDIGPYRPGNGYYPAPVLINGGSQLGYGGGTCQVSSTLFNLILQVPGITVVQRRPHGPGGARYLPHGTDAAVGSDNLNLVIRNDYDFPVRIEASSQDGALTMSIWKVTE